MNYHIRLVILCCMLLIRCDKPRPGYDVGGPISRHLLRKWTLEKIVSPSQTKIGNQIGYTEIFEGGNNGDDNFDKIYRNDTLVSTYLWSRNPWPVADAKQMTVLVSYTNGMKRFFKIYREVGQNTILESSAYLPQIGGEQDSVRYYYNGHDK